LTTHPLTTVAQPFYEIGTKAFEILLERLKNPKMPIQHIILPTKIIIRKLTAYHGGFLII
jgi:LacI family transcriptional regulator